MSIRDLIVELHIDIFFFDNNMYRYEIIDNNMYRYKIIDNNMYRYKIIDILCRYIDDIIDLEKKLYDILVS